MIRKNDKYVTMKQFEAWLLRQARTHTCFHRFTKIGQIFQNVSRTQEVDFEPVQNII